jgi:hypothetical protein
MKWLVWGAVLVVCAGVTVADALLTRDRTKRQLTWQAASAAHANRTMAARRLLTSNIREGHGKSIETVKEPWRLDEVRKIGIGSASVRYSVPGETFDPSGKGFNTTLYFENDILTAFSVTPPPGPPQPTFALWVYFHRAMMVLALAAAGAWLTFILAAMYERSRMLRFGEAALGATLVALTGWNAWRFGPHGGGATISYTGLAVGSCMLLLSIVTIHAGVRRQRREDAGRCEKCLYDLTGNVSGVCPECGTPTPAGIRRERAAKAESYARALEDGGAVAS